MAALEDSQVHGEVDDAGSASYTRYRLQHSTPEHLHVTSRRYFIGPIPDNWLRSHQSWTKRHLRLTNYSSKAATFSAGPNVSNARRITALNGPSVSTTFTPSFPQPRDLGGEIGGDEESDQEAASQNDESVPPLPQNYSEQDAVATGTSNSQVDVTAPLEMRLPQGPDEPNAPSSKRRGAPQVRREGRPTSPSDASASFVTAQERTSKDHVDSGKGNPQGRRKAKSSVLSVTEEEEAAAESNAASRRSTDSKRQSTGSIGPRPSPTTGQHLKEGEETASTSPLIPRNQEPSKSRPIAHGIRRKSMMSSATLQDAAPEEYHGSYTELIPGKRASKVPSPKLLRFKIPDRATKYENQARTKFVQVRGSKRFRQDILEPGEIVKAEKMLVRVEHTIHELSKDYDENESKKVESTTVDKWRELVIVCRKNTNVDECEFVIQMCKSRVIPGVENDQKLKRSAHLIAMNRKSTSVNLYSTLDKTIVIWAPWKKGTRIYILRPQSAASSVEWYTFLQSSLGWKRAKGLQVNIPDLDVSLDIQDPFEKLEHINRSETLSGKNGAVALQKRNQAEQAATNTIIQQSLEMLEEVPEWAHVVSAWLKHEKMGLAWKKYDRLEWVHGANERKMFGTLAMQRTHDLELRPKKHYPTSVSYTRPSTSVSDGQQEPMEEPAAVEGFLIRLTTQKGRHSRLGKKYFNRMYFYTHNQFLCFCKPGKADPPALPETLSARDHSSSNVPQQPYEVPLIYAVDPFPIRDKGIEWLAKGSPMHQEHHDQLAYSEAERRVNTVLAAEGYVNLCHVVEFRNVQGSPQAETQAVEGQAQDRDGEQSPSLPGKQEAGAKSHENDFELVFKNGLVLRLQSFNTVTKKEWIARLEGIAEYWKSRTAADMIAYKLARQTNYERLKVDEEMESLISQEAKKWEVSRSIASPELFNMCGISSCRAITMSGTLYRKPRLHSTFSRCNVILAHGHLLIFQGTLRQHTGKEIPHILHTRQQSIDLKDCYVYSGLVAEGDLLYQNRTFDSTHPGHQALRRVYLEDSWTSSDEEFMTCFVVWQGQRRSLFRGDAEDGNKLNVKLVSRLGVPGRGIVFQTRSRAERDHWVMNIGMEIEKAQVGGDIRVTGQK